jgi:hypothetical protein
VAEAVSRAQARRAVAQLRRDFRAWLLAKPITELEERLDQLAGERLPVRPPKRQTAEAELADMLRQAAWGGRVLGRPVVSRHSEHHIDQLVALLSQGDLAESPFDAIERLVKLIVQILELRGRGGRYGAISNGITPRVAAKLSELEFEQILAQESLDLATRWFLNQLRSILRPIRQTKQNRPHLQALRYAYSRFERREASDDDYAHLFDEGAQIVLSLLMNDPKRPIRCTWRSLATHRLGLMT